MSIEHVEEAIRQLYDPGTPIYTKKAAEEWLVTVQQGQEAWGLASRLIQSRASHSKFFGALTFQKKIVRDWESLPPEQIPHLRDELLSCLLSSTDGPMFVVTRLCVALALFALKDDSGQWPNFIAGVCQAMDGRMVLAASDEERVGLQLVLLEFLTIVPEEVGKADLSPSRQAKVMQELSESTSLALNRIQYVLDLVPPPTLPNLTTFQHMKAKALRCMQSWIQYGIPIGSLGPLVNKAIQLLPEPDMLDAAVDTLIELISHQSIQAYASTLSETVLSVLTSAWVRDELARAIQEQDEDVARNMCRLMTEFGEHFYSFIVKHLLRPDVHVYLDMMLGCTGFPGYFAAEQELTELPLTFWALLQEELDDTGVLSETSADISTDPITGRPIFRSGTVTQVDSDQIGVITIVPANHDDAKVAKMGVAKNVFARLVKVVCSKIGVPPDTIWNTWAADVCDRFSVYRRDCADTLLSCHYVLRDDMLAYLVPLAISSLDDIQTGQEDWQVLESTLFAIKSISDSVSSSETIYLPRLFAELGRIAASPPDALVRVKMTTCRLIGSYAEWLHANTAHLPPALHFLIASIQSRKVSTAAADGLLNVCDVCRNDLVDGADVLVNLWIQVGPSLQPLEKSRLVKAVTNVIQCMPYALLLPRLLTVLSGIVRDITCALDTVQQDADQTKETVLNQLGYLKACCQGIQHPESDADSSTESLTGLAPPAAGSSDPQQQSVAAVIWDVTQRICTLFGADEHVMQSLCSFINETLRNTLPIFTPNLPALITLITHLYAHHPHACLLNTAAATAGAYGDGLADRASIPQREELTRLIVEVTGRTIQWLESTEQMEMYPDVVASYFELLQRYTIRCPWALHELSPNILHALFGGLVPRGLVIQERLAVTAILDFLVVFIGMDDDEGFGVTRRVVEGVGEVWVVGLVEAIAGKQPRSLDPKLADVLFKLVTKYPERTRTWLLGCLAHEGFPTPRVSQEEKKTFVKAVVGSRLIKRTRDAVKLFGLQCRGLANTEFGRAV
ncbi:uncharacterized protein SPPG_01948 [Spizellomyces punctatus DAOM BR117]|uniref:Importin N-terminal domain-containing protein n=1 Tax=Spizellomyces punctatus (strain DAOM BR117) TaxID=645134 RepID=A0A0L0HP83_SPIPD|nr:uncharacterized protein SPPG_01948 [Spizellomyces punctatus DAOM BR117]KND02868.1 hypothetical protein SPPG_01948 [Spizellomyces punctatus DAOM BR117]|eukprot:XP_016610907.1 hypothetical protein SPPG_01948 [Spizellomyces punctatus DAOM BR117]